MTACAQPLPETEIAPVRDRIEEALPLAGLVDVVSGTAGEVTLTTVDVQIVYDQETDFRAEDVTSVMEILEDSWGKKRGLQQSVHVSFIHPDEYPTGDYTRYQGKAITRTIEASNSRGETSPLLDEVTPYYKGSYAPKIECLEIDGIVYDTKVNGELTMVNYLQGGNPPCLTGIEEGTFTAR